MLGGATEEGEGNCLGRGNLAGEFLEPRGKGKEQRVSPDDGKAPRR